MPNRMTLDEFVAACPRELELFAASTRLHQAEGTEGFVGDAYQRRTLADWFAEVTAYLEYTELQEILEKWTGEPTRNGAASIVAESKFADAEYRYPAHHYYCRNCRSGWVYPMKAEYGNPHCCTLDGGWLKFLETCWRKEPVPWPK